MNIRTTVFGVFVLSAVLLAGVSSGEQRGLFSEDDPGSAAQLAQASYPETHKSGDDCWDCDFKVQDMAHELRNTESALCYNCHDRVDEGAWVHGPVAVGECIICHDDFHGPEGIDSLSNEIGGVCYKCHDENRLSQHVTQMDSGDCAGCHNPHSSEDYRLLRY